MYFRVQGWKQLDVCVHGLHKAHGCARGQLDTTGCGWEAVPSKVMGVRQLTSKDVLQNPTNSWEQSGKERSRVIPDASNLWQTRRLIAWAEFRMLQVLICSQKGGKKASELHCGRRRKAWHMLLLQGGFMWTLRSLKDLQACFWTKEGHCHLSQTLFLKNVPLGVYFAHGVAFFQVLRLIESLLQIFLSSLDSIFTVQNKPWGAYYTEIPGLWSKPTESQSPLVVPMLLS